MIGVVRIASGILTSTISLLKRPSWCHHIFAGAVDWSVLVEYECNQWKLLRNVGRRALTSALSIASLVSEGDLSINVRLGAAALPGKLSGTVRPSGLADTKRKKSTATGDN